MFLIVVFTCQKSRRISFGRHLNKYTIVCTFWPKNQNKTKPPPPNKKNPEKNPENKQNIQTTKIYKKNDTYNNHLTSLGQFVKVWYNSCVLIKKIKFQTFYTLFSWLNDKSLVYQIKLRIMNKWSKRLTYSLQMYKLFHVW